MTTPTPALPDKVIGPRVRTAVIIGVIGIVVAMTGVVMLIRVVIDVFDAPTHRIPGTVLVRLGAGNYVIYEHNRRTDLFDDTFATSRRFGVTIDPSTVRITGPRGSDIPIDPSPSNSTLTEGSDRFVSALGFHASTDGTYTLRFDSGESSEVMVQRTFGSQVRHNVGWILAVVGGGLAVAAGVVLLVVGIIRRNSARRAALVAAGPAPPVYVPMPLPPPAWHPDPSGQHRLRYWDGAQWTEHTSE